MKQHIKKEQWDELSDEQQQSIIKFFGYSGEHLSLLEHKIKRNKGLSIGRMIEFLGDVDMVFDIEQYAGMGKRIWTVFVGYNRDKKYKATELADALWEACKDKLNK